MTVHSTEPRLVPTGPTTAVEADWSKALCVFCLRPVAPNDKTKCHWHKAVSASLIDGR